MLAGKRQNSKTKNSFSHDLSNAYERWLAGVNVRILSLSCRSGSNIYQQPYLISDYKQHEFQKMRRNKFRTYLFTPGRSTESWGLKELVYFLSNSQPFLDTQNQKSTMVKDG